MYQIVFEFSIEIPEDSTANSQSAGEEWSECVSCCWPASVASAVTISYITSKTIYMGGTMIIAAQLVIGPLDGRH